MLPMKWRSAGLLIIGLLILSACAGRDITPPPTDIPSPTPQPQPSSLPAPSLTPTPEPDVKPTPTHTPPPTPATSTSLTLRVGGSGQYWSIQEAINSAQPGATIQVTQGTYTENVIINGPHNIRLQGGWSADFSSRSDVSALTVVDGGANGSVFSIMVGNGASVTLEIESFTIRNGMAKRGGGIFATASGKSAQIKLSLTNNAIIENTSSNRGGGIFVESNEGVVDVALANNTISKNTANNEGGGIRVQSSKGGTAVVKLTKNNITNNAVTRLTEGEGGWDGGGIAAFANPSGNTTIFLENNLIKENEAGFGGGVFGYAWGADAVATITLMNNIIAGNKAQYGAGIFSCSGKTCPVSEPGGLITWMLTNNTITGNIASKCVGGIQLYSGSTFGDGGVMTLSSHNDIIWGNNDTCGDQQLVLNVEMGKSGIATAKISYSDIGLIKGAHTLDYAINEDPLFINATKGDFRLQDSSPCIDSGDPDPAFNDGKQPPAKGTERNDMGAYGGQKNLTSE